MKNICKNKKILIFLLLAIFLGVFLFFYLGGGDILQHEEEIAMVDEVSIKGKIYLIEENSILVAEGIKTDEYDGNTQNLEGEAVWFTIGEDTEIEDREGEEVSFDDLEVEDSVEVWSVGVVLESYPAQARAGVIVVD